MKEEGHQEKQEKRERMEGDREGEEGPAGFGRVQLGTLGYAGAGHR